MSGNSLAWENQIVSAKQKRGESSDKTLCRGSQLEDFSGAHADGCQKLIDYDRGQENARSPQCFAEYLRLFRKKKNEPRDPCLPSQK